MQAYARGTAVVVSGGKQVTLQNLTLHATGGNAVEVSGEQHEVAGCSIVHAGCGGVIANGEWSNGNVFLCHLRVGSAPLSSWAGVRHAVCRLRGQTTVRQTVCWPHCTACR